MATTTQTLQSSEEHALAAQKSRSLWGDAMRRLSRNRAAMVSLGIIGLYLVVALFAPLIAPKNPIEQTARNSLRPPVWVTDNPARQPNPENLLGTDNNGRDILSRLIFGIRVSLIVGVAPANHYSGAGCHGWACLRVCRGVAGQSVAANRRNRCIVS
jgi:ABC-type dipeptide/oligopeptide/nickel transport system permease subunit